MASSSGNRRLLLLLLLSLFTSPLVTGAPTRQYFSKLGRTTTTENTQTQPKQEQKQPEFYPSDEPAYGLDSDNTPLPQTLPKTPANQVPPTIPKQYVPPPQPKQWRPSNYDHSYYVTKSDEVSPFQKEIIEADTESVATTESLNEEEFDTTDFAEENPKPTTRMDRPDPTHARFKKGFGMSDTRDLKAGMYHYDLNTKSFTSVNHPYNTAAYRNYKYNDEVQTNENRYDNYDRYSSQTNENGYGNYDRYSSNEQVHQP